MQSSSIKNQKGQLIDGPILITSNVYNDHRGFFLESWNENSFNKIVGKNITFLQDNHSKSNKNVIRGLHYQLIPHPQCKLVRCTSGEILDIIVDIRKSSKTFGDWAGINLSEKNFRQLWIPEGFAHGFLTLSKNADVLYKTTEYWVPSCEKSINWNDPHLSINWSLEKSKVILSEKDSNAPFLHEIQNNHLFV